MSPLCLQRLTRWDVLLAGALRLAPAMLLCGVSALAIAGCGRTLQPRTNSNFDTKDWNVGAVVDASQAFPIAFWADACAAPQEVELAGDTLRVDQWLPHLARRLNEAVVTTGLYDTRFAAIGAEVQKPTLDAGRITYACVPKSREKFEREAVRVARIEYVGGKTERIVSDLGASIRIAVVFGSMRRQYEARATGLNWHEQVLSELGRQVLSDPEFWAGVKKAP
jgi:hypothetical protein